jgi:hypothetical protein
MTGHSNVRDDKVRVSNEKGLDRVRHVSGGQGDSGRVVLGEQRSERIAKQRVLVRYEETKRCNAE